jgi:hypothetical protein
VVRAGITTQDRSATGIAVEMAAAGKTGSDKGLIMYPRASTIGRRHSHVNSAIFHFGG